MNTNIVTVEDYILTKDDPLAKKAAKHTVAKRNEGEWGKYKKTEEQILQNIKKMKAQRKSLKRTIKNEKRRLKAAKLIYKANTLSV